MGTFDGIVLCTRIRFCLVKEDYLLHPVFDDAGEDFDVELLD